jgi:hypothetical protein
MIDILELNYQNSKANGFKRRLKYLSKRKYILNKIKSIYYTRMPDSQRITNSLFCCKKFNKKNNFYKIKFIILIINSLI